MEVNKLEGKEVFILGFGGAGALTVIILSSMYFGHIISMKSNQQGPITVTAAAPHIDVHVPAQAAPEIKVTAAQPRIDVNVPAQLPPVVNVSTPPATVTVLDKRDGDKKELEIQAVHAPAEAPKPIPVALPVKTEKTSSATTLPIDEETSIDTLYKTAESYIASYCAKNKLDSAAENRKWNAKWQSRVEQAINDNTDSSEQNYINRTVIAERANFLMDKATPEQIVEACRLFLRYRDGGFTMLAAMNEALTKDNLKKTVVFLAAGAK